MSLTETELCDYLQVRHAKVEVSASHHSSESPSPTGGGHQQQQSPLPVKFYKHWTSLWVVLHVEISPNYCYIGYCKKESDWLVDTQTIAKCSLDDAFRVERSPPGYSKKYENVLQLIFKGYKLDLGFDSMTKLDQWLKALTVTSERHHVDLVRCPEHPQLEGEYVVQISPHSYMVWSGTMKNSSTPQWEWDLKHIRRVHWHKNVNKLEVEPGRSSDTGEGHFYFTGQHAYRLFRGMKHMMSTHSQQQIASPLPARPNCDIQNGRARAGEKETGSGSESDWTGTGDDWTGASSDSAFINYIRSQHQFNSTDPLQFGSPSASPSPPPPPAPRSSREGIYTNLNPSTLNEDNQYCSVDRLHPKAVMSPTLSPTPIRAATAPTTPLHPVSELGESQTEEDEYCKMVSSGIRADLMKTHELSSPLAMHRQLHIRPQHTNSGSEIRLQY